MKIKSMSRTDPNKRGGKLYEASRNLTEYNQQLRPRGASGNIPASTSPTVSVPKAGTAPAGTRIQSDYEAAQRANARRNYEYRQTTGQLPSQSGENQELSHRRDVVRDRQANYLQTGGTIGSAQNQVFQRSIDAIDAEIARRQNDRQKEAQTRAKNTADALKYNQKTFEKRAKEAKKQYGEDSDEYRAAQQRADEATKAVWEAGLPWQMRVANYADAVGGRLVGTAPQLAATLTRPPENEIRDNEFSRRYQAMNNWLQSTADYFYDVSAQSNAALKYGLGEVGSTVADVAVTGGEMLSDAAMNMILPGSGMAAMGLRAGASGANEAYHAGATPGQEFMYGAATAAVEMLTEKMFDGMAKVYGAGAADEITEGIVRRLAETNGGRTLARILINTPGEGIEEVVSDLANPFIKYIYDNGAALQESYGTGDGFKSMMQEAGYDFLVGAILGVGGAAASVTNGESAARNARLALQDDFIAQMSTGDGSSFFIEPHSGQTTRFGVEQYGDTWWGYAIDGQGKTYWQNGYKSRSAAERGTAVAASDWIVEQAANPENRANDADVRARDEQRAETAAENPGSTIADDQAVEIQKTLQDSGAKNSSLAQAVKLSGIVDRILNGDTSLSNNAIRDLDLYHNKGLLSIVEQKTGEKIDTSSNKRIVADVRAIVERRAELYAIEDEQKTAQAAAATQSMPQTAAETENPAQEDVSAEDVQALPGEAENAVEASTAAETSEDAGSAEPTITLRNGRTVNRQQFIEDIVQARNSAERTVASDAFDKLYAESGAAETQRQATAQQTAAPAQAQQQAEGSATTRRTAQKPGLIRDEYTKSQDQRQMNVIDLVAKRLGVTVRFVDLVKGGAANAQYADGVVEIEKYNRNPVLFLFGHEITHHLQEIAPESYRAFRDAAMMDIPNADEIIQKKIQLYADRGVRLRRRSAMDELAADYAGQMVDNTSVLERFIERHKENRSLLQRLADAFRSLIDRVGGRYRVNAKNAVNLLEKALRDGAAAQEKAERQEAREQKRAQKQAKRERAKENTATRGGEGEARYHINEGFSRDIQAWNNDGRPDGERFILGSTGPVLHGLGAIESDIYLRSDKINRILEQHPEMSLREIQRIPEILEDPTLILKSKGENVGGQNTRMVIFGSLKAQNGKPVLVSLDLRPVERGFAINDMQKVNSAYAKDKPLNLVKSSDILFADKKRTIPLLRTMGLQSRPIELQQNGYVGSIAYVQQNVKMNGVPFSSVVNLDGNAKFSLKEDSKGRALTEAQREYFRDSKAVDGSGRLLTLYHQTEGLFTVFDPRHQGAGSRDNATPFGIFLKTSDRDIGLKGKFQMELYANITNPLYASNRETLTNSLLKLSDEYATIKAEIDTLDVTYHEKFEQAKQELRDFMTEWRNKNPGASRRALYDVPEFNALYEAEDAVVEEWTQKADQLSAQAKNAITAALRNAGYDGVILSTDAGSFGRSTDAYIALDPEQVKNVSNKTPTSDPDIRYSLKTDSQGRTLTEQQREYFKDSKAVDDQGRLMVMYHGTNADFTVFDKGRIGQNFQNRGGDLGFYFSPYIEDARGYAREAAFSTGGEKTIMEVYLNLKNPLVVEDEGWGSAISQADIRHGDLKRWAQEGGYDGIIVKSTDEVDDDGTPDAVYIAFSPEQIKSVTNQNPTDNPDIRYHIGWVDTEAPDAIESSVQRALALRDSDATPSEIFNQTGLVSLPDGRLRDGMTGNIVWEADDERRRKEGQDGSGGAVQRGKTSGGASETRSVGAANAQTRRNSARDRGVDQRQNRQDHSAGKAGTRNWKQLKNAEKAAFRSAVEEYLEETGADVADTLDLVWGEGSGDIDLAIDRFAKEMFNRIGESDLVLENELIAPLGRGNATSLIRKFRSIADEQKSGNVQYSMPAEKRTPSKPRTAYSFAKEVTADYASDFDKHTVAKSVRDIGVLLKDGDERTAAERAHSMAQAVVSTAAVVVNDEEVATRRSIRDYLKGTKLRISDELARGVDGIEALRNGPLAFMTSRTSGLPVDVAYMEMQASFGTHLFPEDVVNPADQLQRIADVLDQLQPKYENPFGRTQQEQEQAVMELAERILDTAEQLPRADLRKAGTFVSMTETREFQEFKRQYEETYGEGATDAAIRSVKAYERAMQREAARRKAMRERPDAAETRAENARILAKARSEHIEARKKASLSRLFESKEKARLRQENRELISWGANYVQQAEAAAERAEQRRVRQLSQQAEHAELMKRRAVLRVKFRDNKTLMSAKIRDGQKLANQKRKTQQAIEDARQARKEARVLARRSAQDSMAVINSSRRNTEQALEPAPIDTLRSIVPEQKKTWAERKHDLIEGSKDTGRKLYTAFVSDTLALEKLSALQVDAGAEGLTSYECAKIAKACNSTIEMTYHDGLYDTDGNRIAEPLKEVAVVWKTENGKKVVDYEGQAVFQDYRLHLHNIDRMSLRERALQKVADFEAVNPWLREAPTRELALIAEGAYTDHGKRKDPRQQIVKDYVQLLKKAREAVNKPVFADTAGNPVTADASQRIVEKYEREYPDIVEQSRRLDEWWDTFMRTYVVGVTMSLEDYEAMREIYPHYTPTYRVNQGQRGRGVYAGGGTVSTGSFVKAATGSLKEVRYIEDSYADLVARAIRQNRFNALCANIVETAMNDDSGTFAGFMLFDWETQKNTVDKLGWLTDRDGLDGSEKHEPPALEKDGGACRVSCWINGERVSAYISEDLYNSLAAVAGNKSNSRVEKAVDVFTGIGNKVTSPMKTLITGINPLFGIRNFIRDVPTAVVNSHAGARMLKYIPKAIAMSKNNSTEWQAYCALGGTSQSYYRNENGRKQGNAIANWDTRSEMTPWGKVKRGAKKAADTIGWFNELTENAVRFAEYLCAIDNLPGGNTYENRVRGIYYAGEVSVDFSRRGTLGRTVNAWIPYWNPAMQGIDKVFRSCLRDVTRKHKGFQQLSVTVARAVLTAAMPEALAMVCRMIAGREDEWEQLSDYVKDNFYCFPIPGKNNQYKFLKVPKNREWAALISNPLWRIVAGIKGREDPFANYWDDSIKANFIPPAAWEAIGIDQYLSIKYNEDFAGRPIVGNQFKDYTSGEYASKKLQYDGDTWAIAKLVSDAMANKLSPVQWEYIIHSYCGDLGDLLFGLVDMDTWNAITGNAPEDYDGWHDLYELVTAGPKKFVADARYSNAATSKYYETMDELGSKVADAKILDPDGYKDSTDYQVRSAIQGSYTKQIQDLNKQIREMADGPEKDALKLEVAATAQEALDFYNAAQNGEITQPKQYMAYEKTGVSATVRDALLALDGLSEDYKFDPSEFSAKKTIPAHAGKEWQLDESQKQQWRDFFADEYNERAEALIGSARYINATDARKAAMLEGVYEEATKAAKDAVVKWMKEQGYSPVKKEK